MAEIRTVANNRKASHDYFFLERFEAGLVLTGTEIKSIRAGSLSLRDSYAKVEGGEVWVYNMNISPYEQGNRYNADPLRPKKLLLRKQEIRKLIGLTAQKGLTLVPVKVFLNEKGIAKLDLAVARGKANYDKRASIAEKDAKRSMDRSIKSRGQDE